MKVLNRKSSFKQLGVSNCILKKLTFKNDYKITTNKTHSHTEYEIHMVLCGSQHYETDSGVYNVGKNEFILIPPGTKHKIIFSTADLLKYSITFNSDELFPVFFGEIPVGIMDSLCFISEEYRQKTELSPTLIENRMLEILVMLFRKTGYRAGAKSTADEATDERIGIAKSFISDNIENDLSAGDVAAYCHLSQRQLTRIFAEHEGVTPAKYIFCEKMRRAGEYVKNTDLSLRQISERFCFNNEYYFNTSFKKYFGMPPLSYRKMFR